jgi:DNA invertase Pin-like site-specific DNA recombinase
MPTAYAYTRVSTTQQDIGGKSGLSRQLDTITDFLINHPHYNLSNKTYTDKASGYHGMNIKDDAGLGSFLRDCKNGVVKAGDLLCVELVDRLSRLPPDDARDLFRKILSYGVKVAIVRWGIIIGDNENRIDLTGDMLLTAGFHLAHMESEQKSKRIASAKQKNVEAARKGGKILFTGKSVPRWLELSEDNTQFVIKAKEGALIERLFNMKLSGLGAYKIMTILKPEDGLMFGGTALRTDSITKLLKNRRVIGEWQPQHRENIEGKRVETDNGEPILHYFPKVITEELFNAVQMSFNSSVKGKAARSFNNVFNNLLKCSDCGHSVSHKISYSKGKAHRVYYACTGNSHRKTCDRKSVHMEPIRDKVLLALSVLDYSRLKGGEDAYNTDIQRGALESQIVALERAVKNLGAAIAGAGSADDITDLMMLRREKGSELVEVSTKLSQLNNAMNMGHTEELRESSYLNLESEEERIKLNYLLRQHIEKITLYEDNWCAISFKMGYMDIKRVFVCTDVSEKLFVHFVTEEEERTVNSEYPEITEEQLINSIATSKRIGEELIKATTTLKPIPTP